MKGTTKNKIKYWAHAIAMDSEALHYALGVKNCRWKKHASHYLPFIKDSIKNLEEILK